MRPAGMVPAHWSDEVETFVDRGELRSWPQWPTEAYRDNEAGDQDSPLDAISWADILRGLTAGASMGVVFGLGLVWTVMHG